MIQATFKKVTPTQLRKVLPEGIRIPAWNFYNVKVTISDVGAGNINVGGRYDYILRSGEALSAIQTLQGS